MHLVIMAWLFVIGTMALTGPTVAGGIAFFAVAGVAPVALYAWARTRHLRARRAARARASALEERVDQRDDADAGGDQR
jgi:hypothetical protein